MGNPCRSRRVNLCNLEDGPTFEAVGVILDVNDPVDVDKLLLRRWNPGPCDCDRLLRDVIDLQLDLELERI